MGKKFNIYELWKMVCKRVPEADENDVLVYLLTYLRTDNGLSIVSNCARAIEKILIEKGDI